MRQGAKCPARTQALYRRDLGGGGGDLAVDVAGVTVSPAVACVTYRAQRNFVIKFIQTLVLAHKGKQVTDAVTVLYIDTDAFIHNHLGKDIMLRKFITQCAGVFFVVKSKLEMISPIWT